MNNDKCPKQPLSFNCCFASWHCYTPRNFKKSLRIIHQSILQEALCFSFSKTIKALKGYNLQF